MITEMEMYWLTRLDGVHVMAGCILVTSAIALLFCAVGYGVAVTEDDDRAMKKLKPPLRLSVVFSVVAAAVMLFLPTMREMAAIKVVPMIANSESIKKLGDVGDNMLDLANEWLQELKPKKEK